jgi:hypothetical protein
MRRSTQSPMQSKRLILLSLLAKVLELNRSSCAEEPMNLEKCVGSTG